MAIHALCSLHDRHLIKGTLHSTNPSATGAIPVQVSTGRLVARGEERIGSTTPMPMTAQNSLAVQQRLQISELQFETVSTL